MLENCMSFVTKPICIRHSPFAIRLSHINERLPRVEWVPFGAGSPRDCQCSMLHNCGPRPLSAVYHMAFSPDSAIHINEYICKRHLRARGDRLLICCGLASLMLHATDHKRRATKSRAGHGRGNAPQGPINQFSKVKDTSKHDTQKK